MGPPESGPFSVASEIDEITMVEDKTFYIGIPEESELLGPGRGPIIPTLGAATSVIDQYRTFGIHQTNLTEIGTAFTDVQAAAALAKIAEGGITHARELENAETALQALLLHEQVHVLSHGPKVDFGNGVVSYLRHDEGARSNFAHDLFSVAFSRDFLIAPEFLTVCDGQISRSSLPHSSVVGQLISELRVAGSYWNADVEAALNAAIDMHGIAAYLTHPGLVRSRRGDGFAKRFYSRLNVSWNDAVQDIPPIVCTFSLPPLLAIVLDRADRREDLKAVVSELRVELAPVRQELRDLNRLVVGSLSQAELEARVRRVTESFDAIVPESRLSNAQRRSRKLFSAQRLIRPLVKIAAGFVMKTGVPFEHLMDAAHGVAEAVQESSSLVDRTVTAQTFSHLLRDTEALQPLVARHFSQAEIDAIERSS